MEKEQINCYEEAVEYIFRIPKFTSKNTMEDTRAFLEKLGNPDRKMKIIHVAGTNGKGSVCAYLCAVLKSAGYTTSLFTSPHLTDIRERFVIAGKMVGKAAFYEAFLTVYEKLPWEELRRGEGYHPTFFEYLFFMVMVLFEKAGTDYCILETGLGGRLDATNAVSKKMVSVITHMGLDHTEYLGDSLPAIAEEKAGIMQERTPVVYWETDGPVADVLLKKAKNLQIPAFPVSKKDYTFLKFNNKSIDFSYQSLYYDSVRLSLNTIARYQMENVSLALRALEVIFGQDGLLPKTMQEGIQAAFWAGRMEEVLPGVYVDGAHNEDGIRAFLETVAQDGCVLGRRLLFGVVQDKNYDCMIKEIVSSKLFTDISVVQLKSARTVKTNVLRDMFVCAGQQITCYGAAEDAFYTQLSQRKDGERIYIVGSLYLVGEIKELI
ncbi:MAG: Mur ligase family protein [Lachnospiraceae bacterium]|nr:Mur ligase family protein [Lachnospiraceae bacterium]